MQPHHQTSPATDSSQSLVPADKTLVTATETSDASSSYVEDQSPPAGNRPLSKKLKERSILLLPLLIAAILATVVALALVFAMHPRHHAAHAQTHDAPRLPSYALAVRTPYLSTWLPGSQSADVTRGQPVFWNGEPLTWNVLARVSAAGSSSAETYALFGLPAGYAGVKNAQQQGPINHTSTHTTVTLAAGDASFILDFFSPVSPKNYTRQTMPYSYLTVQASSKAAADIQIFSAIDGAWTGLPQQAQGNVTLEDGTSTFYLENPGAYKYSENMTGQDQAFWGTTVFSSQASQSTKLDSACASSDTLYSAFVKSGSVSGDKCAQGNLYGHVHHLAGVTTAAAVTYAVGLYQEDAINFRNKSQTPYFRSQFPSVKSSMAAFFADHSDAEAESRKLDQAIITAGDAVSTNYTEILAASVRQSFAAVQIAIPSDTLSTKPEDIYGWLKEISSDGNVNSIDVIYPSFPIFYVLAPDYIRLMLQPILAYLATPTGVWDLPQVPHDLGNHYPNATGHDDNHLEVFGDHEESMPIESTGQTLHMLLAYANATGDHDFAKRFMGAEGKYLLTTYADYLVSNGTFPPKQLTTVDALPQKPNTTQLAVTAAVGVSAMGALAGLANYTDAGAALTQRLLADAALGAIADSHFTYDYADPASFSVMFPLFADKLLALGGANSFEPAYAMQSAFYADLLASHSWGLPYSNLAPWAIVDWNMWSAAICDANVSKMLVDTTWRFLTMGDMDVPFGTKYIVDGSGQGRWVGNKARPTVGANFALLALKGANLAW